MSTTDQAFSGRKLGPNPIHALVSTTTWANAAYVITGFPLGVAAFVVTPVLFLLGVGLLPLAGVGVLLLVGLLYLSEWFGRFERARLAATVGELIAAPDYRRRPGRGFVDFVRGTLACRPRWRGVGYMVVLLPVSTIGLSLITAFWSAGLVGTTMPAWVHSLPDGSSSIFGDMTAGSHLAPAVAVGVLALLAAPWVTLGCARVSAALARHLLGPNERDVLTERVDELQTTRTRVVDAADAERRRIERDLHDGAQQRLVALAVDLGRARAKLEADPDAPPEAATLVAAAHDEAKQTLAELRDLVRGIHPAVLADRGLDAALSALAARCPVPVTVDSRLSGSAACSPSVEAVAYFVVAEALTNVAKHAQATQASVTATRDGDRLVLAVTDNGRGGADPDGGGLRGLADRARALDGTLTVSSPAGGPTTVTVNLPCE